jgi:hypothetical protein
MRKESTTEDITDITNTIAITDIIMDIMDIMDTTDTMDIMNMDASLRNWQEPLLSELSSELALSTICTRRDTDTDTDMDMDMNMDTRNLERSRLKDAGDLPSAKAILPFPQFLPRPASLSHMPN